MAEALDTEIFNARAAYFDNADFEADGSIVKAKLFITACRKLLAVPVTRTAQSGRDGNELELDPEMIARQQDEARRWLASAQAAAAGGGGVIHADFTAFRD
jgi:hypothetical protein